MTKHIARFLKLLNFAIEIESVDIIINKKAAFLKTWVLYIELVITQTQRLAKNRHGYPKQTRFLSLV